MTGTELQVIPPVETSKANEALGFEGDVGLRSRAAGGLVEPVVEKMNRRDGSLVRPCPDLHDSCNCQ
jgi:hypothetical protein